MSLELHTNQSGITPQGPRLLVLPDQVAKTTATGIIVHTETEGDRKAMAQIYGRVVAIGPLAWYDQARERQNLAWAKVGDRIVFAKYAGLVLKGKDGQVYRLISDMDVVALCDNDLNDEYGPVARQANALQENAA